MKVKLMVVVLLIVTVLAGCGGPKEDVPIFMMGSQGIPSEVADKLRDSLKEKVGEAPTVALNTSPMFSMEKMVVELAAGGNGIMILGEEQFLGMAPQNGYVALDDVINPEDYPTGILEMTDEEGNKEKHLYGIPLEETKWMKELDLNGKGLVAFIPMNAKKQEEAKKVMKIIAEK
ncbi:hypothetical protein [Paenibacillus eucommiae]|uniref:ABC-type glycerol-3-phosphate transport system substrate-binding protein n=1 Tax=Paenibacillus eucommiae TaxID=1355755 RepID=A0ABS4J144_9BACL|nr:hypothetical protein [Paenibacillus eucommiae]MBP1993508.1 ABC-type glycerol-3-phosphate transport system substrate-binding protein [Paenibacillus eucommiae]